MNFNFILDEDYLAYYILSTKMYNETKEIIDIKNKLSNDLGYKKIMQEELLDSSIYIDNKDLINEFINTNIFMNLYKSYTNESKENIAIKILKGYIKIDNKELEMVQDNLWNKYRKSYRKILNIDDCNPSTFLLDKDVINTINTFKQTDEFKKLYNETEVYMDNVKKYWEKNKDRINKYLKEILKMKIDIKFDVYISHPNCYEGSSFGKNKIAWGHYKGVDNPNYNLVYLVHEGMHHVLPFTQNDTEIDSYIKHSIIELIADYELNYLLNGDSTLNIGHPYLCEYKKQIFPYWLKYIGLNDHEINQRLIRNHIDPDIMNNLNNIDISNLNIQEFNFFCVKSINDLEKNNSKIK